MEFKKDKKIAIHAYKFNGWLYRTWEFPQVVEETDEYVCVSSQGARIITNRIGSNKHYKSKVAEPSIWYFFKNEWFNLVYQQRSNHMRVYINIASPYIYEQNTIKYIDFDIDFTNNAFEKSHALRKIDINEFEYHSKLLNYPNTLKNKIIITAQKVEQKFINGELDKYFNNNLLNKSGEKYDAKKRLLQRKNKQDKLVHRSKEI